MPAAYLLAISASAPAQFCAGIPYETRRQANAALKHGRMQANGEIYRCVCGKWHVRARYSRKDEQKRGAAR